MELSGCPGLEGLSGGDSGEEPPVPIPNTEVKLASADGTWGATPRESRSLPDIKTRRGHRTSVDGPSFLFLWSETEWRAHPTDNPVTGGGVVTVAAAPEIAAAPAEASTAREDGGIVVSPNARATVAPPAGT